MALEPARELIGERGKPKRSRMGRHVYAVGEERHRAEPEASCDLHPHGGSGQRHHEPQASFVARMIATQEAMVLAPGIERDGMHAIDAPLIAR